MLEFFLARYVYLFVLILLSIGLYGALAKSDLVKKVIGLTIFSTAIYLFFIQGSLQLDGTTPVIDERGSDPALYVDPLPHLLILTAIVVGVGVSGVALALLVRIYRTHGTLDEAVIAERLAGREPVTTSAGLFGLGESPADRRAAGSGPRASGDGRGAPDGGPSAPGGDAPREGDGG
ncbi:MAG: cation:proton antiporter subunit C [Nitriliruptoraceae bacterium]|nr:cation:proton antiporter subunit C [Nitriliruptoraceae bacterium]